MGAQVTATALRPLSIVNAWDCQEAWDHYVERHPKGSVFHSISVLRAMESVNNHQTMAYGAIDSRGQIVALVAAVRIATVSGIASSLASRSIWYAEPLCDDSPVGIESLRQLVLHHKREAAKNCLFTEIRPLQAPGIEQKVLQDCGFEFKDYLNYIVDTSQDAETLLGRLSKSSRNKIRRSLRRGVVIERDATHRGIDRMYRLVQESYARSQVPLVDVRLFHECLDEMGGDVVQIRIARYNGHDVAGGIALVRDGRFYAWYGGSQRLNGVVPFDCLTWDEISWASENGLLSYDFGGAGWPDEEYGPREFKRKFGGELVHFGRYMCVHSPLKLSVANMAYGVLRGILSKKTE